MQRNDPPYKMIRVSFHYVEGWPGTLVFRRKHDPRVLFRIMTQVISLRTEMTHGLFLYVTNGSFCRGESFLCVTPEPNTLCVMPHACSLRLYHVISLQAPGSVFTNHSKEHSSSHSSSRLEAIDEIDQLCKLHENPTRTDWQADRRIAETTPWHKLCWLSANTAKNYSSFIFCRVVKIWEC